MKKVLLFLTVCFLLTISIFGQNKRFNLSGSVVDADTKEPMEQVTVQLLSLPDSAFVAGVVSLNDGQFNLASPKEGKFLVKLSFIGYKTLWEQVEFTSSKPNVRLGQVILSPDAIFLGEAIVVAEAPPVTMKEDTTIYSASAYRVTEGAMLEELVKKLPGAEVDDEGKITINGKEVKKIMVDGKEFFSDDPKVSMKNLPVNIIENVKAYDKKSDMARITGIDDGEEETVLDLTVKKGMKRGWIGNLIAGYGTEDRYEGGGMVSRFLDDANLSIIGSVNNTNNAGFSEFGDAGQGLNRGNSGSGVTAAKGLGINFAKDTKKLQYGGNVQYGFSDNDAKRTQFTENFLGEDRSSYNSSTSVTRRARHDFRTDLRFEWKVDSMTTLIFRPNASYSNTDSRNRGNSTEMNNNRDTINTKDTRSDSHSDNYSVGGRLEFYRKFTKPGRNLSIRANLNYSDNETESNSYSNMLFHLYDDEDGEFLRDSISKIDRRTDKTSNNSNYRISASYTEPVFKNHFLQVRYEFAYRHSLAQSLVYDKLDSISSGYVEELSNKVENNYNTHTAEVSLRGVQTKMMYNVGLSVIPQSSKSKTTIGPNADNPNRKQDVLNFAPSVMFRYRFSKQHVLNLRYRGRSSEPNIEDLQEVIDITDPLNLKYGNPNLKPSFNNNFSLYYTNYFPETMRSYSLNGFFSNTINSIGNRVTYNPETGGQVSQRVNINGNWNTRAFFTFNTPFKNKKYTLSSNTNTSYSNSRSYQRVGRQDDADLSTTRNWSLSERLNGNYRSDLFDLSLNASITYNLIRNNKQTNSNRETFDYLFGGNTNINLPWKLYLSTDVNYRIKDGYSGGLDQNEVLWNAQLSKNFLKNNAATIRFKIYDILQQQTNLSRSISDTRMVDTEYNTLGSYCMVHFVYRLNTLGGRAARSGMNRMDGGMRNFEGGGNRGNYGPLPGGMNRMR